MGKRIAHTPILPYEPLPISDTCGQEQRKGLEKAGALGEETLVMLDGRDRQFFEMNFMAQHHIMLGLTAWAEAGIRATLAEHDGNREEVLQHVHAGVEAFELVREGQQLAEQAHFEG